jgi:hypothetical protein
MHERRLEQQMRHQNMDLKQVGGRFEGEMWGEYRFTNSEVIQIGLEQCCNI